MLVVGHVGAVYSETDAGQLGNLLICVHVREGVAG